MRICQCSIYISITDLGGCPRSRGYNIYIIFENVFRYFYQICDKYFARAAVQSGSQSRPIAVAEPTPQGGRWTGRRSYSSVYDRRSHGPRNQCRGWEVLSNLGVNCMRVGESSVVLEVMWRECWRGAMGGERQDSEGMEGGA